MTTLMASVVDLYLLKEVGMTHFHTLALNNILLIGLKYIKRMFAGIIVTVCLWLCLNI